MIPEILELQQNLSEKRYEYCANHINSKQKIIYYAYGLLQREYIFSTFNIWYALNRFSQKYKVIIGGIGNGDYPIDEEPILIPEEYQNGENSVLPSDLEWIVLPFVSYDLTEVVEKLRANNQGVKIAYQVDFDFTSVAEKVKELEHYQTNTDVIVNNIRLADKVIFANESLYHLSVKNLAEKLKGSGTIATYNIPYINEQILEEVDGERTDRQKDEPVRIGVLCTKDNGADLYEFRKVWKAISDKFKDKVTFVLYGDKNKQIGKAFNGVSNEFTQQTGIRTYYTELFNLNLDCIVIPTQNNSWNVAHYDIERVLEVQALGIPIIVSNMKPINKLIKDEVNGFLCEDRDRMIRQLEIICEVDNTEEADSISKRVARMAFTHVTQSFNITNDANVKKIEEMFL